MTLAAVATWPWGRLRDAFPIPPFEQGVILATDSRFAKDDGTIVDVGKKTYWLSAHAGLVFSGHVLGAEQAVSDLRRFFGRLRDPDRDYSDEIARILRRAHQRGN